MNSEKKLNIAGRLAGYFITSKLTLALIIACATLGLFAVLLTPREENPQIIVPGAQVQVIWPGASSQEVEELVLRPLESIVQQIHGVDHTYGVAVNSAAILVVEFTVGENKEDCLVKLYDRVLGQRDKLPDSAQLPLIKSVDVDDVPILTVTLASEQYNDYALKRIADRMVDKIRGIPEVSDVYVKGGTDRELRIELEPEKLQSYGTTLDQIKTLITAANVAAPMGSVVINGRNRDVFLDGFITCADDLEKLIVTNFHNRPIYLGDVGRIIDGPPSERKTMSRFAFGPGDKRFAKYRQSEVPAVSIAVAKKKGTNAVFVADDVIKRIKIMQEQFIPVDVDVVITRDDGKKANDAVSLLIEHLGIAILVVFVTTMFFLGLKEACIVGITVPLTLSLVLGADFFFGPTINRITLYALILSLGMMVDAAIVVIENIHRRNETIGNADPVRIAVLAVNEIGNPTNLATFAVMIVFLSMVLLTGMPEQYFFPVLFNVPTAMLASIIIAYIVVPWACIKWINSHKAGHGRQADITQKKFTIQALFKKSLIFILDRPKSYKWVFLIVFAVIALSIFQPLWQFIRPAGIEGPQSWFGVEMGMLPKDNKNTFNITIDMSENTSVEVTDQLSREIGSILRQIPEVSNYQVWVGTTGIPDLVSFLRGTASKNGSYVAEIRVNLTDKKVRKKSSIEIVREYRPAFLQAAQKFPGATVQLVEDPPGPPLQSTVRAEIYGPDLKQLHTLSGLVSTEFEKTYDMVEVTDTEPVDTFQYRLVVDKEKAMLSGLTTGEIALALHRLIDGEQIGLAHMENEKNSIPINLKIPRRFQVNPELLARVLITNQQGKQIPLSELVKRIPSVADRPILHKDNVRVTYVGGELGSTSPVYAVLGLDKRFKKICLEDGSTLATGNLGLVEDIANPLNGYTVLWEGEMRMTMDIYRELFSALTLSLLVIYFLLVAYYASFALPLIAMVSIPLGVAGIFPGHCIMHQPFTAPSIIGLLALSGVVVRSSLLIIDFTLGYIAEGKTIRDAVVQSVEMRTRPIILTALAVVLGIAIMLTDPVFGGLAITLIFGTTVSTVMTLIVIPLILYLYLTIVKKRLR